MGLQGRLLAHLGVLCVALKNSRVDELLLIFLI